MKKAAIVLLGFLAPTAAWAQDTLRHFNPMVDAPVADSYPGTQGYHTGHNNYADEEFAEKYDLSGSGTVLGILAMHAGQSGTSSMQAAYKVYSVAGSGLPGAQLAVEAMPYTSIPVDGSPHTVLFASPVSVSGSFFVSFSLGDYAHGDPGSVELALMHSPDGTRPSTDLGVFGRNAIRWHDHGAITWKDYRTENFTGYEPAVHFALFPIMDMGTTAVIHLDQTGSSIGAVYPNPVAQGSFTVPLNSTSGGEATFQLYDVSGKMVAEQETELAVGTMEYRFSCPALEPGSYVLLSTVPQGRLAQRIQIR